QGLHPTPALRHPGPQDVLQDRLPRRRPAPGRLRRAARRLGAGQGAPLLHPVLRGQAAAKKGEVVLLLAQATVRATQGGLISGHPTAAWDGPGWDSSHPPRSFLKRAGRKPPPRLWTKLTVACDTASHFFAGATVTLGPSNDSPQFTPVLAQASLVVGWDR